MKSKELVIQSIERAFEKNTYPGENFLQGSFEGSEPYDEIAPFKKIDSWQSIEAKPLDTHSTALNFFSEAALRFFRFHRIPIHSYNGILVATWRWRSGAVGNPAFHASCSNWHSCKQEPSCLMQPA